MIRRGDHLKIKPEWADEGDENIVFVAIDDESKGRVNVMAMLGLAINPTQSIKSEMIDKVIDVNIQT